MRRQMWVMAAVVGLGLAAPGWAQNRTAPTFGGVNPQDVTFRPVDLSHSVVPAPQSQQEKFSFRRLFSKVIPGLSPTAAPGVNPNMVPIPPTFSGAPGTSLMQAPAKK